MRFHLYPTFKEVEENGVSNFLTWFFSGVLEIVTIISKHLILSDALTLVLCEFSCAVWTWQSMCAGAQRINASFLTPTVSDLAQCLLLAASASGRQLVWVDDTPN